MRTKNKKKKKKRLREGESVVHGGGGGGGGGGVYFTPYFIDLGRNCRLQPTLVLKKKVSSVCLSVRLSARLYISP